jgi:Zn-dependent protease with chaperone function
MYGVINKNYMSLSREMEFHADAVAASVSGSENLITALKKLEISDAC